MPWCFQCSRSFVNDYALQQHYEYSNAHKPLCGPCNRLFRTPEALAEHQRNSVKHLKQLWNHVCECCKEGFDVIEELEEHDQEVHTYCTQHERVFINENNLKQVSGERRIYIFIPQEIANISAITHYTI